MLYSNDMQNLNPPNSKDDKIKGKSLTYLTLICLLDEKLA